MGWQQKWAHRKEDKSQRQRQKKPTRNIPCMVNVNRGYFYSSRRRCEIQGHLSPGEMLKAPLTALVVWGSNTASKLFHGLKHTQCLVSQTEILTTRCCLRFLNPPVHFLPISSSHGRGRAIAEQPQPAAQGIEVPPRLCNRAACKLWPFSSC